MVCRVQGLGVGSQEGSEVLGLRTASGEYTHAIDYFSDISVKRLGFRV